MRSRPGASKLRALSCCVLIAWVAWGCTFERRDSSEAGSQAVGGTAPPAPFAAEPHTDATALIRAMLDSFRESVAAGDLSTSLARLDSQATLLDPLVGRAIGAASRGELLLELRTRHAEGIRYTPLETEVVFAGERAALVTTLLSMSTSDESGVSEDARAVFETAYLILSDEGWKIRHLHRSFTPSR